MLENTSGKTSGWNSYLLINKDQIEEEKLNELDLLVPITKAPIIYMIKSKDPIQRSDKKWTM